MTSVENEWYGTQAGSVVDVLILQSNYPADIVKTVVEADNANWFFTNVYGPLAASQAAGRRRADHQSLARGGGFPCDVSLTRA